MGDVAVWILHAEPRPAAGPLERWVAAARRRIAERHHAAFLRAGAASVRIVAGPPDDTPFGARIRSLLAEESRSATGVVILGSGTVPLAAWRDLVAFVRAAAADVPVALANNRYSADITAVPCAQRLADAPDLPADNALPRWLEEVAGYEVADRRDSWRLGVDVDGPLDLVLVGDTDDAPPGIELGPVRRRLAAVARVASDRRAELVIAGRTSPRTLVGLEDTIAAQVRALVEERGLRAASRLAQAGPSRPSQRAPASVLGMLLDADGPASLGDHLRRLGDAALVDTRVLIAHRFGPDERTWPRPEDRFAADLLLGDRVEDPWLRELTMAAANASVPIVLGGHTLVGPGLRLALDRTRWS